MSRLRRPRRNSTPDRYQALFSDPECRHTDRCAEEGNTIPLTDNSLMVDISDALSEKDKVKFTVHTRTTMKNFQKPEFLVVRQHEEFIWLHDRYEEEAKYAGYIIPPPPPRPNFDASREKLQRLGEGEGTMTKEEFTKMKQELEAEYLATFKKTVAMHEVFLTRLASHSIFREDSHLHVFLEYDQDLCARPKGKLQQLGGLFKSVGTTTDQYYLNATVRDVNDFFEQQMNSLTEYHSQLKEATYRTDRMTEKHKELADSYIKISSGLLQLANSDNGHLDKYLAKVSDTLEKIRKIESRVASDQDLKLADTLRYYMRDSQAAKALLVRRLKCLANYENANRTLEKARHKNKDIHAAEHAQSAACEQFESISAQAKEELLDFKTRRLHAFKKSLIELVELEIKHSRTQQDLLKKAVSNLKELL
ncbi:sorting nexin 6 isoform X1 [Leptinotarsa decemlineata]|uniref:sorting nexin 6 isoform X1 n=1 Tax=Leptinotarsa decemlineata TaxID=7539 RepID=UPI000C253CF2|nr:sorting nexin-6 isoform X1 [Leptinotarsa decemlineata]